MEVTRYKGRHWAVWNADGSLLCVCVYRRGADEVRRLLCVQEERSSYVPTERTTAGGYYVAFPAHLVEEVMAFLPPDERSVYAERFERIVGDLVWVREDAENAVQSVLQEGGDTIAPSTDRLMAEVSEALLDFEDDALVVSVTEALTEAARRLITSHLSR